MDLVEQILLTHKEDESQVRVLESDKTRILVEAPAGNGKTKTLISKLAISILDGTVPNPKRILALTFSVNAAAKMRRDLDKLCISGLDSRRIRSRVIATNYHGFCRIVLRKYGFLLGKKLGQIESLRMIQDDQKSLTQTPIKMRPSDAIACDSFADKIKQHRMLSATEQDAYNELILNVVVKKGYLTHNAVITLTSLLFSSYPRLRNLYRQLFPLVLADEFQDTNVLSYSLLTNLVSEDTRFYAFGDPLQRIYGFIGAVPGLFEKAQSDFQLERYALAINHRFRGVPLLRILDQNIRKYAAGEASKITETASITLALCGTQAEEGDLIARRVAELLTSTAEARVAVLFRAGRNDRNTAIIAERLREAGIEFFNAMFTDEDREYVEFHILAERVLRSKLRKNRSVTKAFLTDWQTRVKAKIGDSSSEVASACLTLLRTFCSWLTSNSLASEERLTIIDETLQSRALKHSMEHLNVHVVLATVHAAKGLEWDSVIMADMERDSFPSYPGACGECRNRRECGNGPATNPQKFMDELSVFYVGVTRARKTLEFSASTTRTDKYNRVHESSVTCFLHQPGISISVV